MPGASGVSPMMLHCYSLVTINQYDEVSLDGQGEFAKVHTSQRVGRRMDPRDETAAGVTCREDTE
jgi:hypothetical protein